MCIVCIDLFKQKMTLDEAQKNLGELVYDKRSTAKTVGHQQRLKSAIDEFDLNKIDEELKIGVSDED